MNELFGAATPTPWTPTTARYRANVLEWARLLAATRRQAGAARLERAVHERRSRAVVARPGRRGRHRAREVLQRAGRAQGRAGARQPPDADLDAAARPRSSSRSACRPRRSALVLAFQTRRGSGGREGLRARRSLVRGGEAAGARGEGRSRASSGSRTSGRGAGASSTSRPPIRTSSARPACGCGRAIRSLCDADALREPFDRDLRAGQIDLPRASAARSATRADHDERDRRARPRDRRRGVGADRALRAARASGASASVGTTQTLARERAIVRRRFGGSTRAYRSALARARATLAVALAARSQTSCAARRSSRRLPRRRALGGRDRGVLPHLRRQCRSARSPARGRRARRDAGDAARRDPAGARAAGDHACAAGRRARRRLRPVDDATAARGARRASAARTTGCPLPGAVDLTDWLPFLAL